MTIVKDHQSMSAEEAVLVLGLYRFARRRATYGERLTPLAAGKVAAMARIIGINTTRGLAELGIRADTLWWTTEVACLLGSRAERLASTLGPGFWECLSRLETLLQDLSVSDVEGYEEPNCIYVSDGTLHENTGVHRVSRLGETE